MDQSGLSLSLSSRMPRSTAEHLFKTLLSFLEIDPGSVESYPAF
jgi:hypothetical protein